MSRQGTPLPKSPPAAYMPAPPEVTSLSTSAPAAVQEPYVTENGKYRTIRSVTDIDWSRPLYEQLEPNLKGGPRSSRTFVNLCMLRAQIPKLTKQLFDGLLPSDNTITAMQKSHGVHKIHMSEVAAWVLNATHWFSLLQQPMMVMYGVTTGKMQASSSTWCRYYRSISMIMFQGIKSSCFDDSKIYGSIQQWQEPTTIWDGKPVLGFMAETFLDDLPVIGFKDFNPMWTFPTTPVNQCWEPMTFGMPPWHLCENVDKQKSKEALQSQSPIAAFKACNMIQALGIAYSKIVLPSSDSKGANQGKDLLPHYMDQFLSMAVCIAICWSIETGQGKFASMQRVYTSSAHPAEQQECESSQLCLCRHYEYHYARCHDQLDSMHCSNS